MDFLLNPFNLLDERKVGRMEEWKEGKERGKSNFSFHPNCATKGVFPR